MPDENFAQASEPTSPQNVRLPYEQGSSSELLSANHLFSVEIVSLQETPWAQGADGLEHRQLDMNAKLLETFKGDLTTRPPSAFRVQVAQSRESEFVSSDYHGLWSHISPAAGSRYLVFADASSNSPAALMQEGPCEKLLDAAYVSDVRLAVQAETLFQRARTGEGGAEHGSIQELLRLSNLKRSAAKDLYERYLWARVGAAFREKHEHVLSQLLEMIAARDAEIDFRSGLISDVYDATVDLQPDADLTRRVLRVFFSLLLQKEAAPLHEGLVDVEIYGLAFEDEKPALSSHSVFPESGQREQFRSVIVHLDSERARDVAAWLSARK